MTNRGGYRIQQTVTKAGYYITLPELYGTVDSARERLMVERKLGNHVRIVYIDGLGGEEAVRGYD